MLTNTDVSLIDEQREILDLFCDTETHLTIEDAERLLKEKGMEIPRSLIENTFDLFSRYGIASKHSFHDGRVYYEHKHLKEHHDHMVCVNCGRTIEFFDPKIERLQIEAAARQKFHPLWHTLEIYGLCDECFGKSKEAIPLAFAPIGDRVKITSMVGGYGIRKRLTDLGLIPGAVLEVINNSGPFIVVVKGSRVAIGLGVARKIIVKPVEKDEM